MLYRYRAVNDEGQIQLGELDAHDPADLEGRLQRIGLTLIRARTGYNAGWTRRRISRRDLITFCLHLEQLTHAGVPIVEALTDLRGSLDHPQLRNVMANIVDAIGGGLSFSQALAAHPSHFDPVFVCLVKAGESCGKLPEVLHHLSETLKWQDELAAQARKILLYPAFVGTLVFGVFCFLMIYLVPRLVDFVQSMGQTLPLGTRILLAMSRLFIAYGGIIVGLLLAALAFIRIQAQTRPAFRCRIDGWKIRLPLIGTLLHKIILARFARFFAMLYAAGIPILEGLQICEGVIGNTQIAENLREAGRRISEGQSISASFAQVRLFPALLLRMLHVGETTGGLDQALLNVAYFYDRDVRESIERIQRLIEPVLTVILGLILAWIMSAVLGPVFDLMGQLR